MSTISFDDLTFACASTRWLGPYKSTIEEVLGSFGSGVKATVTDTFDSASRTGIQLEGSRENLILYSQQRDQCSLYELPVDDDTTNTYDPLSGNTAEDLIPTANEDYHYADLTAKINDTSWSSGRYTVSSFYKGNGYNPGPYAYQEGDHYVTFSSSTWADLEDLGIDDYGFALAGNSWAHCWFAFDATYSAPGTVRGQIYVFDGNNSYFPGDGSSIYDWQFQYEYGHFPSSIIPTISSYVTRAADNAYWDEGDVDSNLRGKITVYVIPRFSSSALYNESSIKHTVLHFDDATQDVQIYFEAGTSAGTGRVVVYGASALITTGNLTWTEGQLLKVVIDPSSGELVLSLFTSGDGTHGGSSWSTDDGDVYLGQSSSNTEHFFGVIFEPEYEGTEPIAATITESASAGDAASSTATKVAAETETASAAESQSAIKVATTAIAESASSTDQQLALAIKSAAESELASASDTVGATVARQATVVETATATDTPSSTIDRIASTAESAGATESQDANKIAIADAKETPAYYMCCDSDIAYCDNSRAVCNYYLTASAAESQSAIKVATAGISESANAGDAVDADVIGMITASITESASAIDTQNAVVVAAAGIAESATATDQQSATAIAVADIAEIASATDTADASMNAFVYASQIEAASAIDTASATVIRSASIIETADAVDVPTAVKIALADVLESATVTDVATALTILLVDIDETATATDTYNGLTGQVETEILETANAIDMCDARLLAAVLSTGDIDFYELDDDYFYELDDDYTNYKIDDIAEEIIV